MTPEKEIVWEYRAPFDHLSRSPYIYRAYRYPYDYVPQLEKPEETPVERVDCMTFRMPGAAEGMLENITTVPEALGYTSEMAACVTEDDDEKRGRSVLTIASGAGALPASLYKERRKSCRVILYYGDAAAMI